MKSDSQKSLKEKNKKNSNNSKDNDDKKSSSSESNERNLERSREEEENNTFKKESKNFLSNSNHNSNYSSNSNSYGIQTEEKNDKISLKFYNMSCPEIIEKIEKINSPCVIKSQEILKEITKFHEKRNELYEIPNSFLENINKNDVIYLDKMNLKIPNIKNSIIINSQIFEKMSQNDEILFNKFHNYLTGFCAESKISDFCFNKDIYFPYSYNDIYYKINRKYTQGFRAHHYHYIHGLITYQFGIKGNGRSLCGRAIISNYLHFKILKKKDVFFPTIFLDIKIFIKNIFNKEYLFNLIKYESLNLFREKSVWLNFVKEFKKIFNNSNEYTFNSIIIKILSLCKQYNQNEKILLVIDNYSTEYDEDEDIQYIKRLCQEDGGFDMYIIYNIETPVDQAYFVKNFTEQIFIISEYKPDELENYFHYENKEASCYFKYELRNINELKQYIDDVPDNYQNYFGDNISYYFKFKSLVEVLSFEEFVKQEKENILQEIKNFYEKFNLSNKKLTEIINNIILNESKIINQNINLFDYINGSYFIFYKTKSNNNSFCYEYKYAFPLVKSIYNEFYQCINENFFIDIRNPEFLKLDGVSMGICFDKYMNFWFKKIIDNNQLFSYVNTEIEVIKVNYLIKKNTKKLTIKEIYKSNYISKEIEQNNELLEIKNKYSLNEALKSKKCIVIFQDFNAKGIDILFLVKMFNNDYNINSVQIKCSDFYEINDELLFINRFEMTYLKNKVKLLLGINVTNSFITYLTIKEMPKKCAINNLDKFFYYSIKEDKLVDRNNNEIENLPFYESCKIHFIEEDKSEEIIKSFIFINYTNINYRLIPTLKNEIFAYETQINNTAIIQINKDKLFISLYLKNRMYNYEKENFEALKDCEKYYQIIIEE